MLTKKFERQIELTLIMDKAEIELVNEYLEDILTLCHFDDGKDISVALANARVGIQYLRGCIFSDILINK